MSEAIAFDTHRFVKNLTANGFTEKQAEALANEQVQLLNSNLATKTDILAIKSDILAIKKRTGSKDRNHQERLVEMDGDGHGCPGRADRCAYQGPVGAILPYPHSSSVSNDALLIRPTRWNNP